MDLPIISIVNIVDPWSHSKWLGKEHHFSINNFQKPKNDSFHKVNVKMGFHQ